jgi:hypothetical protein
MFFVAVKKTFSTSFEILLSPERLSRFVFSLILFKT